MKISLGQGANMSAFPYTTSIVEVGDVIQDPTAQERAQFVVLESLPMNRVRARQLTPEGEWDPEGELVEFLQGGGETLVVMGCMEVPYEERILAVNSVKPVSPRETNTAWLVLMVEHEWGQRDEGWTMWSSREDATYHKRQGEEGGGEEAPGQSFSYSDPLPYPVTAEVWALLSRERSGLSSRGRHLPPKGQLITLADIRRG